MHLRRSESPVYTGLSLSQQVFEAFTDAGARRGATRLSAASGQNARPELVLGDCRLSTELHVEAAFLVAAVGLDRDLVADLLAHDRLAEVLRP